MQATIISTFILLSTLTTIAIATPLPPTNTTHVQVERQETVGWWECAAKLGNGWAPTCCFDRDAKPLANGDTDCHMADWTRVLCSKAANNAKPIWNFYYLYRYGPFCCHTRTNTVNPVYYDCVRIDLGKPNPTTAPFSRNGIYDETIGSPWSKTPTKRDG